MAIGATTPAVRRTTRRDHADNIRHTPQPSPELSYHTALLVYIHRTKQQYHICMHMQACPDSARRGDKVALRSICFAFLRLLALCLMAVSSCWFLNSISSWRCRARSALISSCMRGSVAIGKRDGRYLCQNAATMIASVDDVRSLSEQRDLHRPRPRHHWYPRPHPPRHPPYMLVQNGYQPSPPTVDLPARIGVNW